MHLDSSGFFEKLKQERLEKSKQLVTIAGLTQTRAQWDSLEEYCDKILRDDHMPYPHKMFKELDKGLTDLKQSKLPKGPTKVKTLEWVYGVVDTKSVELDPGTIITLPETLARLWLELGFVTVYQEPKEKEPEHTLGELISRHKPNYYDTSKEFGHRTDEVLSRIDQNNWRIDMETGKPTRPVSSMSLIDKETQKKTKRRASALYGLYFTGGPNPYHFKVGSQVVIPVRMSTSCGNTYWTQYEYTILHSYSNGVYAMGNLETYLPYGRTVPVTMPTDPIKYFAFTKEAWVEVNEPW